MTSTMELASVKRLGDGTDGTKETEEISDAGGGRRTGIEAPTIRFTGHSGEIFSVQFSEDGKNIATAGADRSVLVYNVYGECQSWCQLNGHKSAILEISWSCDGAQLYSASADHCISVWDVERGVRIKKLNGHLSVVNSVSCFKPVRRTRSAVYSRKKSTEEAPAICSEDNITAANHFLYTCGKGSFSCNFALVSGSDDGTTRVWDLRARKSVMKAEHQYQVLSVALDGHGGRIFAGSLDNTVRAYDLRSNLREVDTLAGHMDSVTGLGLNHLGTHLLSNSMDQTVRLWDIQPFVRTGERQVAVLRGVTHNYEKNMLRVRWSPDGSLASAGSADRNVCIWDMEDTSQTILSGSDVEISTRPLIYRLPGHAGSVNDVAFHPNEPIVASASSDKTCYMGELM